MTIVNGNKQYLEIIKHWFWLIIFGIVHPFPAVGVERYERVAAQSSLEARHPLMDVHLEEFCLSIPWHLKTHRGWTKNIMRHAM